MISGENDNNRETCPPLWFFVACHDLLEQRKTDRLLDQDCGGRTLKEVLISIVEGYLEGTENGIHVDKKSAWCSVLLITPGWIQTIRQAPRNYPIEIQARGFLRLSFYMSLPGPLAGKSWQHWCGSIRALPH